VAVAVTPALRVGLTGAVGGVPTHVTVAARSVLLAGASEGRGAAEEALPVPEGATTGGCADGVGSRINSAQASAGTAQ